MTENKEQNPEETLNGDTNKEGETEKNAAASEQDNSSKGREEINADNNIPNTNTEANSKVVQSTKNSSASSDNGNSNNSNNNNPKLILVCCVLAAVAVLALWLIFTPRRHVQTYDLPIPYIFNSEFFNYLRMFVDQDTHKEILIVHGPTGIGKTRGLNEFANILRNDDDRMVFDFDFKTISKYSTYDDFLNCMDSAIIKGFKEFDGKQSKIGDFKVSSSILEAIATVDGQLLQKKHNNYFKDQYYQKYLNSLLTIVDRTQNDIEAVKTLLFSFDSLYQFKPVLIVHDINSLSKSNCPQIRAFRDAFWKATELFADDTRQVPVIVEISEDISLIDGETPISSEKMRLYRVKEFSDSEARLILVKGKIFTKKVYQFVSEKIGWHGQSYATMYDMMKEGIEPQTAYNKLYQHSKNLLERAIRTNITAGILNRNLKFVKQLCLTSPVPISFDSEAAVNMLKWKAVTLINSTHCAFPNQLISRAAKEI